MNNFFESLFDFAVFQSAHIGVLFVLALLLCRLLSKAGAHVRYLVWLVVIVKCFLPGFYRLDVPVLPVDEAGSQSAVSLPQERSGTVNRSLSNVKIAEPVETEHTLRANAERFTGSGTTVTGEKSFAGKDESSAGSFVKGKTIADIIKGYSITGWAGVVYAAGIVIAAGWFISRAVLFSAALSNRRRKAKQIVLTEFEALCEKFGLKNVKLWADAQAGQPYVWGLLRGGVYVPADFGADMDPGHVKQVLAHELCHVKRFDAGVNILQVAAGVMFWFNPLVWFTNAALRRERERCCDEAVIARLGNSPRSYSKAIVDVLTAEYQGRQRVPSVAVAGPVKNIEQRIKSLLRPGRKFSSGPGMFALACVIIAAVVITPVSVGICRKKCAEIEDNTNGYYIVRYTALAQHPEVETRQKTMNCKTKKEAEELVRKLKRSSKFKDARIDPDFKIYLPTDEFIGVWKGNTKSIMTWTNQKFIDVNIKISQDGYVEGRVGDAKVQGYFTKIEKKDRYAIRANLSGEIIDAEDIARDSVFIHLRTIENNRLKGSLRSSGWHIGGKNTMALSTINMVLDKVSVNDTGKSDSSFQTEVFDTIMEGYAAQSKDNKFITKFDNGVSVELVGICEHPSKGKQWWKPDGSELDARPYEIKNVAISKMFGRKVLETVIKIEGFDDGIGLRYNIEGTRNSGSSGSGDQKFNGIVFDQAKENNETNISVGVAAGQWETVQTQETSFGSVYSYRDVIWHAPVETNGKTVLNTAHTMIDQNVRFVAVDKEGKEHRSGSTSSIKEGLESMQTTFDLPLSEIKEFKFQIRPYEWISFKNVSLKPNYQTNVQIEMEQEASEAIEKPEAIEEQMQEYLTQIIYNKPSSALDLDTGKLIELRDEWPNEYDISWENDEGGVLFTKNSSVWMWPLLGVNNINEAISKAHKHLDVVSEGGIKGFLAKDIKYVMIKTSESNYAVLEITEYDSNKAKVKFKLLDKKGVDIAAAGFELRCDGDRGVCYLQVGIENAGFEKVGEFKVRFFRGPVEDGLDEAGNVHSGWHGAGPIEPGGRWDERTRDFHLADGQYEFNVVLDYENAIAETDENNNRARIFVQVVNGQAVNVTKVQQDFRKEQTGNEETGISLSSNPFYRKLKLKNREESMGGLHQFGIACVMYGHDNDGNLPGSLADVGRYVGKEEVNEWLTDNIIYFGGDKNYKNARPQEPIAYDKVLLSDGDGTNVLFVDGHVEYMTKEQMRQRGVRFRQVMVDFRAVVLERSEYEKFVKRGAEKWEESLNMFESARLLTAPSIEVYEDESGKISTRFEPDEPGEGIAGAKADWVYEMRFAFTPSITDNGNIKLDFSIESRKKISEEKDADSSVLVTNATVVEGKAVTGDGGTVMVEGPEVHCDSEAGFISESGGCKVLYLIKARVVK